MFHALRSMKGVAVAFDQIERPLNYQVVANGVENIESACEKILSAGGLVYG